MAMMTVRAAAERMSISDSLVLRAVCLRVIAACAQSAGPVRVAAFASATMTLPPFSPVRRLEVSTGKSTASAAKEGVQACRDTEVETRRPWRVFLLCGVISD